MRAVSALGATVATPESIFYNYSPALLYEHAMRYEPGSHIVSSGALAVSSGKKTGRSPKDKRIVDEAMSRDDIWWGKVNMKLDIKSPANSSRDVPGLPRSFHAKHARPSHS